MDSGSRSKRTCVFEGQLQDSFILFEMMNRLLHGKNGATLGSGSSTTGNSNSIVMKSPRGEKKAPDKTTSSSPIPTALIGANDGDFEGSAEAWTLGLAEASEGKTLGTALGSALDSAIGSVLGECEASTLGGLLGELLGCPVAMLGGAVISIGMITAGEGTADGIAEGGSLRNVGESLAMRDGVAELTTDGSKLGSTEGFPLTATDGTA
eukprot:scaffold4051_cov161-Pinguiococcus_pyrenoidosus.AAC.1